MFIILPNNSTKKKTLELLNKLNAYNIENMIQQATYKSATIILPKFHVKQTSEVQNAMQKMGLNDLFSPQDSDLSLFAEQSGMKISPTNKALEDLDYMRSAPCLKNPHIYVNQIIHKVVLTVDEIGTEGGAATASVINKMGSSVMFIAETPFLFLIRHNSTKLPLFYGAVFEPSFNK